MRIDGVFSGGGLKGFALVGAVQELEKQGYRFRNLAGTSAGAILASFLAAGYTANEIEKMLAEEDFQSLLDPRKTLLPFPFMKWVSLYWRMGLYQGKALEDWFFDKLARKGCYAFGDLPKDSLKLVASDLTNGKMMLLPDDLEQYGYDPDKFSIAKALRMSCGIPYFFEPVRLDAPKGAVVVDGGVLSNFPMWIFDDDTRHPLIGLKLSRRQEETSGRPIHNALQLFEALFSTMKNAHDEKYISREHEKNIVFIPVDDYSATQFDLTEEQMEELLNIGRNRTKQFLRTWSPTRLQVVRKQNVI
ncbi:MULTISPECIES: patatin-like phospholipase family protein [Sporosarcina]|uniref:NTE family protein n=2 Tax=Sporosarcina newyorkensis TaxID=759851 RepID=A0A1T4YZ54_9BACL|nr:patatin-like phospholipase family protein [Sporosarcina newyorkensis]EGQ24131.1 patatin family phospholipase [Sporosarcina newyorkensis 2681]SKB06545.1 NTE family protein [Sporosarcina newyorkensis]